MRSPSARGLAAAFALAAVAALAGLAKAQPAAPPPAYSPPAETSRLLDSPGLAKAQTYFAGTA